MSNPTITANQCFIVEDTRVIAIVEMLDAPLHTDTHPFCDDVTCPCHHDAQYVYENVGRLLVEGKLTENEATALFSGQPVITADETTMPDDIRKYYEPIEERSYDHPGVPAPCWENCDEEEYPISRRTFEYDIPESRNGRTYHTTSSRVDWD